MERRRCHSVSYYTEKGDWIVSTPEEPVAPEGRAIALLSLVDDIEAADAAPDETGARGISEPQN